MQWPEDHMSTDAKKKEKTHKYQCYAPNATNHSPTPTFLEVANTTLKYAHIDITSRSNNYMKNWKNTTEGGGR